MGGRKYKAVYSKKTFTIEQVPAPNRSRIRDHWISRPALSLDLLSYCASEKQRERESETGKGGSGLINVYKVDSLVLRGAILAINIFIGTYATLAIDGVILTSHFIASSSQ